MDFLKQQAKQAAEQLQAAQVAAQQAAQNAAASAQEQAHSLREQARFFTERVGELEVQCPLLAHPLFLSRTKRTHQINQARERGGRVCSRGDRFSDEEVIQQ